MTVDQANINDKRYAFLSLLRTGDMLNRYMGLQLKKHGITPSNFGVMNAILSYEERMTPTAISKWLFRSKHAVTFQLHVLEAKGVIKKEINNRDYRSKYVKLTDEGCKGVEEVMPTVKTMVETVFSCLDHEEIDALNSILKRLRKHLYERIDNYMTSKAESLPMADCDDKTM